MYSPQSEADRPKLQVINKKDYVDYKEFTNFMDSENRLAYVNMLANPSKENLKAEVDKKLAKAKTLKKPSRKKISSYDMQHINIKRAAER